MWHLQLHSYICVTDQPGSEVSLCAAGKAEKGCWSGTCITPGKWTYCLGLKAVFQHFQNFAQINNLLVGFSGLFRLLHCVWHCCGTCVWHCHAPSQLHFEDIIQSAEQRNPISGCAMPGSLQQSWRLCTQQVTILAVLQPVTRPEKTPGKGVLLAQNPFSVNIIIFQCQGSLSQ